MSCLKLYYSLKLMSTFCSYIKITQNFLHNFFFNALFPPPPLAIITIPLRTKCFYTWVSMRSVKTFKGNFY